MKQFWIYGLSAVLLLASCDVGNGDGERRESRRSSSGQPYEMMVVHDGDSTVIDAARQVLAQPFPALPQPESWFDLRFVHIDDLANLHKRQRNILFLGTFGDREHKMARTITDLFGEATIDEILENPNRFYSSARNVWAAPQVVLAFFGQTGDDLADKILGNKDFLIDQLDAIETRRFRREILDAPYNRRVAQDIEENHNIKVRIPTLFETAKSLTADDDERLRELGIEGLVWLRGETDKTSQELLIYYKDLTNEDEITVQNTIAMRDSVGKYFVPGPTDGTFIQTEKRYNPREKELNYNDKYALEVRGLWRLYGGFMGGPFINYAIYDEANQRIIYFDGFIFAPEVRKRDFIKRLEITLNTLEVPEPDA